MSPTNLRLATDRVPVRRKPEHILVESLGDRVRKTYREGIVRPGVAAEKFLRELAAYRRFAELGATFVPALLACDEDALWLEIERVADGRTLADWVETAASNSLEPVIIQLITIDKFLCESRINYLQATPKDIMVGERYKLYLIDFEYTYLDERFQQILYERMFDARMMNVKNTRSRDIFLAALAARRMEFYRFLPRKVHNGVLGRLGVLRANRLVTK